ncbi:MAG: type VI secretion system-associated protein TagF [Methylomicrobium sp.]|nr:type VI secretion system-associated protein TagF [Methylomicrobium sp.]
MHSEPGFYGKLPMLGDFISRRLPRDFLTPWDNWLQSSISASREELGNHWLNSYISAPIWRFVLSPCVCGQSAWAGILMPSVDKVGRYFPLTVAARIVKEGYLPDLFCSSSGWFEHLEAAALSGLEDSLDTEEFDRLVQNLPAVPEFKAIQAGATQESLDHSGKNAFYVTLDRPDHMSEAIAGLSEVLLDQSLRGYSLWSTLGSDEQPTALLVCEGMPPLSAFSGLLTGNVGERGWNIQKKSVQSNQDKSLQSLGNERLQTGSSPDVSESEQNTVPRFIQNNESPVILCSGWASWSITDIGKRRKFNEDAILDRPDARLWVVADGMGGHTAGDVASQMIVDTLQKIPPQASLDAYVESVRSSLLNVNAALRDYADSHYKDRIVGSTVLVLIGDLNRCAFLWAGDSRLYRLRNNKLVQLTRDHCYNDDNLSPGSVSLSGWGVKQSNIITRAVGADDDLDLDCETTDVFPGDTFLLSSDGLDKELSRDEIESILVTYSRKDSVKALMDLTLERGARDNVSLIVVNFNH